MNAVNIFQKTDSDPYTYRISHRNINDIKFDVPHRFKTILFDSNLNCNLHCVYCHNYRDNKLVKEDDFVRFIETQVESVLNFQIGCAMEPTMDKRMTKFALIVSKSKAKPTGYFRLQTNGTLLHKHNIDHLREAGISKITVSIDTINPDIHKEMRGGSDLDKILKNIKDLKSKWPESTVQFITTINSRNIDELDELCEYAVDNQIRSIELRKMFYRSNSNIIKDHEKMKNILLEDAMFDEKISKLVNKYKNRMKLYVNDSKQLENHRSLEKT